MNIYEKLQKARVTLQEKELKKSGKNKFAGFQYFELKDFLPHINSILSELKLFSKFDLKDGTATLAIIDSEKPDEVLVFETPSETVELKGSTAIQALGATHTYLKRYLYLNALEIIESDLLDSISGSEKAPESGKTKPSKLSDQTLSTVIDMIAQAEDEALERKVLKGYKVESLEALTEKQAQTVITTLKSRSEKK